MMLFPTHSVGRMCRSELTMREEIPMKALSKLMSEAKASIDNLLDSLEINPSKIILINAIICIESLLKAGLMEHCGYSKEDLSFASFYTLTLMSECKFKNINNNEHWSLLKNLTRMRNHVAHGAKRKIPFGKIVPCVLKPHVAKYVDMDFLRVLKPEYVDIWKLMVQVIYVQIFADIKLKDKNLVHEFKTLIDIFIASPEGREIVQQIDERVLQLEKM